MSAGKLIASKAGYAATCLLAAVAIVVSGYAHKVVTLLDATGRGIAINGSPSIGEMNILVMGLESRTNYEGQTLPESLLTAMHAGNATSVSDGEVGSQDTDTLILLHIDAGGHKAVGISIPRDDLVTYPHSTYLGVTQGKIDQAYAFAYDQSLSETVNTNDSSQERYLLANQAGQLFEIQTVEAVTGVHIDHFVEANLAGFYYLAQAFGGIYVCITPAPATATLPAGANLQDLGMSNSGWNALADGYNVQKGGTQYLFLQADQALAYVRDRDSLPEVDLDRTKRQQAVIDYVIWALKHRGAFTDIGYLDDLLGKANQYLITDSTFNLLDFATEMQALTGQNLTFWTLPVSGEVTDYPLNGSDQDINTIDVPYVQQYVNNLFYPAPPAPKGKSSAKASASASPAPDSSITVDVYNGSDVNGLAGQVSQALVGLGYKAGAVANATSQSEAVTSADEVFYGAGAAANAAQIATQFGTNAQSLTSLPAGHVEILLGTGATGVPPGLVASSSPAALGPDDVPPASTETVDGASAQTASSSPSSSPGNDGQTGGAVTVAPNAKYGVPCVY